MTIAMRRNWHLFAFASAVVATVAVAFILYPEEKREPEFSTECGLQNSYFTQPTEDDREDIETIRSFLVDHRKIFNLRHVKKACITRLWDPMLSYGIGRQRPIE
jgi:hypothetical protein